MPIRVPSFGSPQERASAVTDPFAHLRAQQPNALPPDPNYDPNDPFAHLRKRVDEDRNVVRYIGNILEGSARALYVTFTDPDENESPETQAMRYAIARVQEGGGEIAFNDFVHAFSKTFKDLGATWRRIQEDPVAFKEQIKENGIGVLVNEFAMAFVQPIGDLIEADTGVQMATGEYRALTPEEQADRYKNFIGFIAGLGVGKALGTGILRSSVAAERAAFQSARAATAARRASSTLDEMINVTANRTTSYFSRGNVSNVVKDFARSTAIGSATGATWSAIAFANEDDQLAQILLDAVIFAPIGFAFDAVGLRHAGRAYKNHTQLAKSLMLTRQVQAIPEGTVFDVFDKVGALANANTIHEAVLAQDKPFTIIPNLTEEQTLNIVRTISEKEFVGSDMPRVAYSMRKDQATGRNEVLILKRDEAGGTMLGEFTETNRQLSFWEEFGFLSDQLVSYNGKDYILRDVLRGEGYNLRTELQKIWWKQEARERIPFEDWLDTDAGAAARKQIEASHRSQRRARLVEPRTNRTIEVPLDEVRHLTSETEVGPIAIPSGFNLRGQLEDQFRRAGASLTEYVRSRITYEYLPQINSGDVPLLRWADRAIRSAKHGEPATLIAFRANPRHAVTGTGRFYSGVLDEAIEYLKLNLSRDAKKLSTKGSDAGVLAQKLAQELRIVRLNFKKLFVTSLGRADMISSLKRLHPELPDADIELMRSAVNNIQGGGKTNEVGYQIADKVIARVMHKLGYDGIMYGGGSEIVDLRGMDPKTGKLPPRISHPPKQRGIELAFNVNKTELSTFFDTLYQGFREALFDVFNQKRPELNNTLGLLNEPTNDFAQVVPQDAFNFNKMLNDYLQERGYQPSEVPAIRNEFHRRFIDELARNHLPAEERAFLARARQAASDVERIKHELDARTLMRHANSNGMYFTREEGGKLIIRDMESNRELYRTTSFQQAMEFVNMSGQHQGFHVDGGGDGLPPIAGDLMEPMGNPPNPYEYVPDLGQGKFNALIDTFNTTATFLTRNREIFISIDNKFGTKLFANVFDKTQEARKRANAAIHPYYERLSKIDKKLSRWSQERRERITAYIETMSPGEVIERYLSRKLNDTEIATASTWFANDVNIDQVFVARRQFRNFEQAVKRDPRQAVLDYLDEKSKTDASAAEDLMNLAGDGWNNLGMSGQQAYIDSVIRRKREDIAVELKLTNKDVDAWADVDNIVKSPAHKLSLGGIVRLYRSMKGSDGRPEMSRAEFAAKNNMPLEDIEVAKNIEAMYADLAREFGIAPQDRLGNYTTHARLYNNGNVTRALRELGAPQAAKEFYAEMTRTGEINPYEMDPILAMQQYVKAGFDAKYFNKAYNEAREALRKELRQAVIDKTMPVEAVRHARHLVDNYLTDLKGHADAGRLFTQATVDKLFEKLGWDVSFDVRRGIVNYISSTAEAAAQGFRIAAGIRDFVSGVIVSHMRYGAAHTIEVLKNGLRGLDGITARDLETMGIIPRSGIVTFSDPTEFAGGVVGKTRGFAKKLDEFNQLAFKLSMQQNVYRLFHAGHYLTTWKQANEGLVKLAKGDITRAELAQDLLLRKYDAPVVAEFWRLVDENDFEGAARFLGVQTGQDMVGVYGLANHPAGWNTNAGRLFGQFGQWSVWFSRTLARELSRGTVADRAIAGARFSASQALTLAAGSALGLDLMRWLPITGLFFFGGPTTEVAESITDMLSGNEYVRNQAQRNLLSAIRLMVPAGFFMKDISEAMELADDGDDRALFRALGIPIDREQ